jgi:hypothetical protein
MLASLDYPPSAFYFYYPVMLFDKAISHGKTQTITLCFCGKEGLKYFLLYLLIDTYVCTYCCKGNEGACAYNRVVAIEQRFNLSGLYSPKLASFLELLPTLRYPAACCGEVHFQNGPD